MTVEDVKELLELITPYIYVIAPIIFGIYLKLRDKFKETQTKIKDLDVAKAKEEYSVWKHEESQRVIRKIKDMCNLYKDKSNAGLAQYLQLENGTMATSKICNMFVSCLAEDDRYGRIPKLSSRLQRVPYAKVTSWINKIIQNKESSINYVLTPNAAAADYSFTDIIDAPEIKSCIIAPVYDQNEILLGMCIFYYPEINFCNHEQQEIELINRFRTAIESVLWEYHNDRKHKKQTLKLEGEINE